MPRPTGLDDLLAILDLKFISPTGNGTNGNPAFAILGHSSALTAREVSAHMTAAYVASRNGATLIPPPLFRCLAPTTARSLSKS